MPRTWVNGSAPALSATNLNDLETELATSLWSAAALSTKTANYTATSTDKVLIYNGSSLTATVPDPTTVSGRIYTIKNIHSSNLTVDSAGTSKTIDGAASVVVAQYKVLTVVSDGTAWFALSGNTRGTDVSYYTATGSKANQDGANQLIATPTYETTGSTVNLGTTSAGTVTITAAGIYSFAYNITLFTDATLTVVKPVTARTFLDIAPATGATYARSSINTGEDGVTANHAGLWIAAGQAVNFKLYQGTGGTAWYSAKVWITKHPV